MDDKKISEFIDYLTNVKNYSLDTITNYKRDLEQFEKFNKNKSLFSFFV